VEEAKNTQLAWPRLVQTSGGSWLAVSAPGSRLRIAVVDTTEALARAKFASVLSRWADLLNEYALENAR
jgi:hypothetical protein